MAKIKAIHMVPGNAPQVVEIESDLKGLQGAVGGYIELVSLDSKTDAFVNGDGLAMQLPFNCVLPAAWGPTPVVGSVIVVSHDHEGETVGLSEGQIKEWLPKLKRAVADAILRMRPHATQPMAQA